MNEGEKLAYLAGIIDGEGCIAIDRKKHSDVRKEWMSYAVVLSVGNNSFELITWLKDNFGGNITEYVREDKRTYWRWATSEKKTLRNILKQTRPYLVIKKEQADLAISYSEKCCQLSGRRGVPIWLKRRREEYFQAMKKMHHI